MTDLEKIRREWLNPCGTCDFGLVEYGCTCPEGDYRNVIGDLVAALEDARSLAAKDEAVKARLLDEAQRFRQERQDAEERVRLLEAALACPECGAVGIAPCVVKGTAVVRSLHRERVFVP